MSRIVAPAAGASARIERGAPPLPQRVTLIDVTRGLLVLLMTSAHALALSKVSDDSFWRSAYWLPHGWATVCFILLSGYTMGFLLPWQGHQAVTRTKLLRGSRDLLVVMFVSNVVFLALRHVAEGTQQVLLHWRWWLGLLTFETPSSISFILLPTGVLLMLAPHLFALEEAHPCLFPGFVVLVTVGVTWGKLQTASGPQPRLLALLLQGERLGMPFLPLLAYGGFGMAAGRCSRRFPTMRVWLAIMGVTGFILLQRLHSWYPQSAVAHVLGTSLLPPTKLAVMMSVSWLLLHMRWQRLTDFFRLLGVYALFAFIVHRLLLQSIDIGLNILAVEDARCRYGLLMTSTMLLTFGLCWWRQRHAKVLRTSGRIVKADHAMRLRDDSGGTRMPATVGRTELMG
jgi:hypothetical protein